MRRTALFAAWSLLFLLLMAASGFWEASLRALFPAEVEVLYARASMLQLLGEHLLLVAVSSGLAILVGIPLGVLVTRPVGRAFLGLADELGSLAQTFPPVAVLALAVPLVGFGFEPTILALVLFSVLPILRNTITGLDGVSPEIVETAFGMGMTRGQTLARVELPLAFPVIVAGIRTSVVINVGTATIGAVIGAGGLGTAIISGLVRENPAFVLQGALGAALLAFTLDQGLALLERSITRTSTARG